MLKPKRFKLEEIQNNTRFLESKLSLDALDVKKEFHLDPSVRQGYKPK